MAAYGTLKSVELIALCKQRGIPYSGKKAQLVKRLRKSDAAANRAAAPTIPVIKDEDEFGLSSGDEAELLDLDVITPPTIKRDPDDRSEVADLTNEIKREDPDGESGDPDKSMIKLEDGVETKDVAMSSVKPEDSSPIEIATRVLRERFQIPSFRLKQQDAIIRLLDGESTVVIFPTGGGKSLCYQVPALCFKELDKVAGIRQGPAESGITLVVSPLTALMKDQCDALRCKGISAAVLDSSVKWEEQRIIEDTMRDGKLEILYCAPERLSNERFVSQMAHVKGGIRLLAVDEAHCISEWGHAFRPDYLKVARFAKEIEAERVVCLTATATPKVAQEICQIFDISEAALFRTSIYRSNLKLSAMSYDTKEQSHPVLISLLRAHPGSTIVYVTTQTQTEDLAQRLRLENFNALAFHAGMRSDDKAEVQESFMESDSLIIVATIAFGMGIDKANIRTVIHYDIPRSLEGYSQEIGRAGRDGLESQCILFLCGEDLHLRESFIRSEVPSKTSVRGLLQKLFSLQASERGEALIEANSYALSSEFDIPSSTLGNIYAQLELRFGILRAATPKYFRYRWKQPISTKWDQSSAALAIHNSAKVAKVWSEIDVELASTNSGVPRPEITRKLYQWHEGKYIDLEPQGVINVFRVGKNWPPTAERTSQLVDDLYNDLENREQRDLARLRQVIDLITGSNCFAHVLTNHFGDILPGNTQACGNCSWCKTKIAVPRVSAPEKAWNSAAFCRVLRTVKARDDARYLARIAFGIYWPRVHAENLGWNEVFGSMQDISFMALLNAYQKICDKEQARLAAGLPPSDYASTPPQSSGVLTPAKRPLARSTSTGYKTESTPAAKRTFGRSLSTNSDGNPYPYGSGAWHQYRRGNPKWTGKS